jgi:hypothetical protein
MKKVISLIILLFICLFCLSNNVFATKFYEGDYISGEYISKVNDGKIHYLTMKFINDSNGNVLYCMEPFVKFYEDYDYSKSDNYKNYDSSILRKVELLSYYGYGYKNRTSSKWYVITQYLIWKTVSSNDIYFTDKLNGKKITKYTNEMNELLNDVNKHDINNLVVNYDVDYNSNLELDLSGYEIIKSDYEIKDNIIKARVNHVMEDEHYIEWIAYVTENSHELRYFEPNMIAETEFEFVSNSKLYAYCNKHGLWKNEVK